MDVNTCSLIPVSSIDISRPSLITVHVHVYTCTYIGSVITRVTLPKGARVWLRGVVTSQCI